MASLLVDERAELYNARSGVRAATRRRESHAARPHDAQAEIARHTSRQAIRWADMDMLGHVNNTSYFRYFEQARIEWPTDCRSGDAFGHGPVIVNASCTFLVPLVYPGESKCACIWATRAHSIGSYYELTMNERKYAEGAAKIVWIDSRAAAACRCRMSSRRRCARCGEAP